MQLSSLYNNFIDHCSFIIYLLKLVRITSYISPNFFFFFNSGEKKTKEICRVLERLQLTV